MIEWFDKNDFERLFREQWESDSMIFEEMAWIECSLNEIQSFAKTKPNNITEHEDSFIDTSSNYSGSAWRWYVTIDNKLGLITCYEDENPYVAIELPGGSDLDVIKLYMQTFSQLGLDVKST